MDKKCAVMTLAAKTQRIFGGGGVICSCKIT